MPDWNPATYNQTTQLTFSDGVNTIPLPYTSRDNYQCYPEEIGSQLEMISGRIVSETRGHVQKIHYHYDCMGNTMWRKIASFLRSSRSFEVIYLPDDSDEYRRSTFVCESLTSPKFAFMMPDENGNPMAYWHDIDFNLREVSPHD